MRQLSSFSALGSLGSLGSLGVAFTLSGCILATELCGPGFVEEDGRCLIAEAPPPYYGDLGPDRGLVEVDAAPVDALVIIDPDPDPAPPEPEPEPAFDPWRDRPLVLIVDRTSRGDARNSPTSPGFDLDAILVIDENSELVGLGGPWESAQINDPFGRNLSRDPDAVIGEPDANGLDDPNAYVSLGGDGGYVYLRLELFEPIRTGLQLLIFEMDRDRADERAEVFLCLEGRLDLSLCRSAGDARGNATLVLD